MSKKWKFNNGDLVRYCRLPLSTTIDPDIGVITDVDEFGDYRVVWSHGGWGWYACSELEGLCKSET